MWGERESTPPTWSRKRKLCHSCNVTFQNNSSDFPHVNSKTVVLRILFSSSIRFWVFLMSAMTRLPHWVQSPFLLFQLWLNWMLVPAFSIQSYKVTIFGPNIWVTRRTFTVHQRHLNFSSVSSLKARTYVLTDRETELQMLLIQKVQVWCGSASELYGWAVRAEKSLDLRQSTG